MHRQGSREIPRAFPPAASRPPPVHSRTAGRALRDQPFSSSASPCPDNALQVCLQALHSVLESAAERRFHHLGGATAGTSAIGGLALAGELDADHAAVSVERTRLHRPFFSRRSSNRVMAPDRPASSARAPPPSSRRRPLHAHERPPLALVRPCSRALVHLVHDGQLHGFMR